MCIASNLKRPEPAAGSQGQQSNYQTFKNKTREKNSDSFNITAPYTFCIH
jgi:hypothetical protein